MPWSIRADWVLIQISRSGVKRVLDVMASYSSQIIASSASSSSSSMSSSSSTIVDKHRRFRMKLGPLLAMETTLTQKLVPQSSGPIEELSVRAGGSWKQVLELVPAPSDPREAAGTRTRARPGTADGRGRDDTTTVLAACREDIISLWTDPAVQSVLRSHDVRMEDSPGLCVNPVFVSANVLTLPIVSWPTLIA